MIKGIDVSTWQGNIDWKLVKAAGISFAMIRAGFGLTLDNMFIAHIEGAKAAGLHVGVYWFCYALTAADAEEEADACLAAVAPYKLQYPIAYDFEYDSVEYASKLNVKYTKQSATEIICTFCEKIRIAGYKQMVYANPDYLVKYIDMSRIDADLWLAAWGYSDPPTSNESDKCQIWQYAVLGSEAQKNRKDATVIGTIPGVNSAVNVDISYKEYARTEPIEPPDKPEEPTLPKFSVGDTVQFTGNRHYSWTDALVGLSTTPGLARITQMYMPGLHPYHLRAVDKNGRYVNGVYGWVDSADILPVAGTPPGEVGRTHTVKRGDTLWGIAVTYLGNGTRYVEIKELNGLTSDVIYIGQVLKIPD